MFWFILQVPELAPYNSKQLCVCLKTFNGWMHEQTPPYFIPVYFSFGSFGFCIKLCWLMDSVIQLLEVVIVCASQPCKRNSTDLWHYASIGTDSNCTNQGTHSLNWQSPLLIFPSIPSKKCFHLHLIYVFLLPKPL